jgi:hypothetical protein
LINSFDRKLINFLLLLDEPIRFRFRTDWPIGNAQEVKRNLNLYELINLRKWIHAIFYQHFHCIDSNTKSFSLSDLGMDENDEEPVPLPNVNAAILKKVIATCLQQCCKIRFCPERCSVHTYRKFHHFDCRALCLCLGHWVLTNVTYTKARLYGQSDELSRRVYWAHRPNLCFKMSMYDPLASVFFMMKKLL